MVESCQVAGLESSQRIPKCVSLKKHASVQSQIVDDTLCAILQNTDIHVAVSYRSPFLVVILSAQHFPSVEKQ